MEKDGSIFILGEGSRVKYSFDYPQVLRRFPERVLTAPVAEGGMTGVALGASLEGMRPVVDLTFNDLALRAMDEIINHVAKVHFMSGGKLRARMVIKADFNRPENAQSGNRLESFFIRFPGLKVFVPSTPSDAYFFMKSALEGEDPVLFFEDRIISAQEELKQGQSQLPIGKARVVTRGRDLTLVSYGCTLGFATAAVKGLNAKGVEIIDLRSLNPLDIETVVSSVATTGRLLLVEPDHVKLGVGAELAAVIGERCFRQLKAPVRRVGTDDLLFPAAVTAQGYLLPTVARIRSAVSALLAEPDSSRVRKK